MRLKQNINGEHSKPNKRWVLGLLLFVGLIGLCLAANDCCRCEKSPVSVMEEVEDERSGLTEEDPKSSQGNASESAAWLEKAECIDKQAVPNSVAEVVSGKENPAQEAAEEKVPVAENPEQATVKEEMPAAENPVQGAEPEEVHSEGKPTQETAQEELSSEEYSEPEMETTSESEAAETKTEETEESSAPIHEHRWEAITETIHHEAEYETIHHEEAGHYEEKVVQEAWDEEITEEITSRHDICKACGMDMTQAGFTPSDISAHGLNHMINGEEGGFYTETRTSYVTTTRHHDALTEQQWIVDQPAWDEQKLLKDSWDETIVTGYRCSVCGAVK